MKNIKLTLSILFLAVPLSLLSQFEISGQYRPLGEVLHGYKKLAPPNSEASFCISQRTRLSLAYNTEKYSSKLSIQDVRLWGDEDNYSAAAVYGKSKNTLDIHEAWVSLNIGKKSHLKVGRQELNYDDSRLISKKNRLQSGMSYDALLYRFQNKNFGLQLDIGLTLNNHTANLLGNDYYTDRIKTLDFLYLKKEFSPKLYASFLFIGAGYQKLDDNNVLYMSATEGVHINYNANKKNLGGIFGKANLFFQNGKNAEGKTINAQMITGELGYKTTNKKFAISLGADYLSGNDNSNTSPSYTKVDHTFNLFYGSRFNYYGGNLNYFVLNDKDLKEAGLLNPFLRINYSISKSISTAITIHQNFLANPLVNSNDPTNYYEKNLGTNIDLSFKYKTKNDISLSMGFSYGIPNKTLIMIQNTTNTNGDFETGNNYYSWIMLSVSPKFLYWENK